MENKVLLQLWALSLYVFFVGFTFCDGFKLHIVRKMIWFVFFIMIALSVYTFKGKYDLALILPYPTLLAITLCMFQKLKSKG